MVNRRGFLSIAAAGSLAALSACSTGNSSDSKKSGSSAGASGSAGAGHGFPVSVQHAFGTTQIKKAPKKVVIVGWSDADICVALGVVPVAAPKVVWGQNSANSTDWYDAAAKKLGGATTQRFDATTSIPVDKIAQYQPDLILGTNSGMTKSDYSKLSQIAPTVAYPGQPYGTSWEDSTKLVAKALGKSDKGEQVIADTKKKIESALSKYPELKGKSASWIYFTPTNMNSVGLYAGGDNRPRMLQEFGETTSKGVENLVKGSKQFFVQTSAEKASEIDSQIVVFDEIKGADVKTIMGNAMLSKIPALKRGSYVALKDLQASAAMSSPTPLSIPVALDKFLPLLSAAAKKA